MIATSAPSVLVLPSTPYNPSLFAVLHLLSMTVKCREVTIVLYEFILRYDTLRC